MANLFQGLLGGVSKRFSPENPTLNPEGYPKRLFEDHKGPIPISDRTALQLSVVYSAIRIPAEDLAGLTLGVYESSKGYLKPIDHDLNYLFQVKPSDFQTAFQWKESVTASVAARGNSFSYIDQRGGTISAIEYLDDSKWDCELVENSRGKKQIVYFQRTEGGAKVNKIPASRILHIPFTAFYGSCKSESPIQWLKDSIRYNLHSLEYGNEIMRNGMFGSGFLEIDTELSEEASRRISHGISRAYGGSGNAGSLPVLEGGLKFKPAKLSPADAQWIASRKFEIEDLLRPFRVPAHMINHLEKSSFNNISEMALGYVKFCLYPWTQRWEAELNSKLLSQQEYDKGIRIKFRLDDLLKGDIKTHTEYIQAMVAAGVMTRAEAREFLGLKEMEGTDELIIPQNIFGKSNNETDEGSEDLEETGE